MTAPNLKQIIADHQQTSLFRHERKVGFVAACLCGWIAPPASTTAEARALHAAHVVAAIRDSGYTVIALPEPEKRSPSAIGVGWGSAMRVTIWDNNPGIITIPVAYEPLVDDEGVANLTTADAADLGAALIAAAQHATGDTQ